MQANSEMAQPVAFMPASVADSWRFGVSEIRVQQKGGFLFEKVGGLITHSTTGDFTKGTTLIEVCGCSEGCGQEGESSDGVLHFMFFSSLIFLLALRSLVCLYGFDDKKQCSSVEYEL